MTLNNIFKYVFIVCICLLGICFYLWRVTSEKLDKVQTELSNANSTITTLNKDITKLTEYITKKDTEIKKIEEDYKKKLENVPRDVCGDVKPSEELLQYLKRNVK